MKQSGGSDSEDTSINHDNKARTWSRKELHKLIFEDAFFQKAHNQINNNKHMITVLLCNLTTGKPISDIAKKLLDNQWVSGYNHAMFCQNTYVGGKGTRKRKQRNLKKGTRKRKLTKN